MSKLKKLTFPTVLLLSALFLSSCMPTQESMPKEQDETKQNPASQDQNPPNDTVMEDKMEANQNVYVDISPQEAKQMTEDNPDLIIIDVSPSYDKGHLPGAINYYVGDGSLDKAIPELDRDADYLVYCHVDSASIAGAQALIDAGFSSVYRLEGNYVAWVDAGYEIEK